MIRNKIKDLLEKFEENRKANCDVVELYNSYGELSSKITSFAEKQKAMSESHKKLIYLLNNPSKSMRCYIDGECHTCLKVEMDWQIAVIPGTDVLVAKTAGKLDWTKILAFTEDVRSKAINADVFNIIEDHRNAEITISLEKAKQLAQLIQASGFTGKFKSVLVYSKPSAQYFKSFEVICQEFNLNIRCFDSLELALDHIEESIGS